MSEINLLRLSCNKSVQKRTMQRSPWVIRRIFGNSPLKVGERVSVSTGFNLCNVLIDFNLTAISGLYQRPKVTGDFQTLKIVPWVRKTDDKIDHTTTANLTTTWGSKSGVVRTQIISANFTITKYEILSWYHLVPIVKSIQFWCCKNEFWDELNASYAGFPPKTSWTPNLPIP